MTGFPISIAVKLECSCGSKLEPHPCDAGVTCESCGKTIAISPAQWVAIVEPAVLDGPDLPAGSRSEVAIAGGEVWFERTELDCKECYEPIADHVVAAALGAATGACPHCRAEVAFTVRVLPPELAAVFPAVSHLIETNEFHAWHVPALRTHVARTAPYTWKDLDAIATDRDGNLYVLGNQTAACLDRNGIARWVRTQLPIGEKPRIAVASDGTVLVWAAVRASAIRLSGVDGSDLGTVGGHGHQTDRHYLDLRGCKALAPDSDGTLVFLNMDRLLRADATGAGIPTWPPHKGFLGRTIHEKLAPFGGEPVEQIYVDGLKDHPTLLHGGKIAIGWDGRLYVSDGTTVICFDRAGKQVYKVATTVGEWRSASPCWGADAVGCAYYLDEMPADRSRETYAVRRISPTGQISMHIDGSAPATPIRGGYLAIAPDGTVFLVGNYNRIRVFDPDGKLHRISATSLEDDRRWAADRAKRIARGEDP